MSAIRAGKESTPDQRTQFGGGDGLNNHRRRKPPPATPTSESRGYVKQQRVPLPSSRRFGTRPPRQTPIAAVLKEAIADLAQQSPVTSRRSLTMIDLTSSAKRRSSPSHFQGDQGKKSPKRTRMPPGRLVYQQLLLNAWRHKKQEANEQSASVKALQQQVDQLQLQKATLQSLRDSESKRREEALSEKASLQSQMEQLFMNNKILITEMAELERQVEEAGETIEKLSMDKENIKNHLQSSIENTSAVERQLDRERVQLKKMREDNYTLIEQLQGKDDELVLQSDKIRQLQDMLLQTETAYNTTLMHNQTQEVKLNEMEEKVEELTKRCAQLEIELEQADQQREEHHSVVMEMRNSLAELKAAQDALEAEKQKLRAKLNKAKDCIKMHRETGWWKTTRAFVSLPLHALNSFAHSLLPALQPSSQGSATNLHDL